MSLPEDLLELEEIARQTNAGLLILDPLISRLSADLNSHVDHEVRRALEPVVWLAERAGMAVVGIIHHNKSGAADPLQLVMGSKAFTAVARSVHTVIPDPDDESGERRLFGTPKNNLGRVDLPTLSFTIMGWAYETDHGTGWTGQLVWGADFEGSIFDALDQGRIDAETRTATQEAIGWLDDYLTKYGGKMSSATIKKDGHAAGHSVSALKRARLKLGLAAVSEGFPRITYWARQLDQPVGSPRWGECLTEPTGPTGEKLTQLVQSVQSVQGRETVTQLDLDAANWCSVDACGGAVFAYSEGGVSFCEAHASMAGVAELA